MTNVVQIHRLGTPSPFCQPFEFTLQQGLERSNTFLSAFDFFLSVIGWLLVADDDKQLIVHSCLTTPVDPAYCAEENDCGYMVGPDRI